MDKEKASVEQRGSARQTMRRPQVGKRYDFRISGGMVYYEFVDSEDQVRGEPFSGQSIAVRDGFCGLESAAGRVPRDVKGQMYLLVDAALQHEESSPEETKSDLEGRAGRDMAQCSSVYGRIHQLHDLVASRLGLMQSRYGVEHRWQVILAHYVAGAGTLMRVLPSSRPSACGSLSAVLEFADADGVASDWCLVGSDIAAAIEKLTPGGAAEHDSKPDET